MYRLLFHNWLPLRNKYQKSMKVWYSKAQFRVYIGFRCKVFRV